MYGNLSNLVTLRTILNFTRDPRGQFFKREFVPTQRVCANATVAPML
jgi:hypothetical protein